MDCAAGDLSGDLYPCVWPRATDQYHGVGVGFAAGDRVLSLHYKVGSFLEYLVYFVRDASSVHSLSILPFVSGNASAWYGQAYDVLPLPGVWGIPGKRSCESAVPFRLCG